MAQTKYLQHKPNDHGANGENNRIKKQIVKHNDHMGRGNICLYEISSILCIRGSHIPEYFKRNNFNPLRADVKYAENENILHRNTVSSSVSHSSRTRKIKVEKSHERILDLLSFDKSYFGKT